MKEINFNKFFKLVDFTRGVDSYRYKRIGRDFYTYRGFLYTSINADHLIKNILFGDLRSNTMEI